MTKEQLIEKAVRLLGRVNDDPPIGVAQTPSYHQLQDRRVAKASVYALPAQAVPEQIISDETEA